MHGVLELLYIIQLFYNGRKTGMETIGIKSGLWQVLPSRASSSPALRGGPIPRIWPGSWPPRNS